MASKRQARVLPKVRAPAGTTVATGAGLLRIDAGDGTVVDWQIETAESIKRWMDEIKWIDTLAPRLQAGGITADEINRLRLTMLGALMQAATSAAMQPAFRSGIERASKSSEGAAKANAKKAAPIAARNNRIRTKARTLAKNGTPRNSIIATLSREFGLGKKQIGNLIPKEMQ
jgi:hypothetical protein